MKILVTGGAGFVGSHVVDTYITAGHDVIIIDNLSTGKKKNLNPDAKFYNADIRSRDTISKIFRKERPDIINHLAAQKSVQKSIQDPLHDADVNIGGLISLLENSIKYSIKKFIFTSTGGAIYGNTNIIPTPETHKPDITSPYALTKYTGEQYMKLYNRLYNVPYTILRPSNIYGPRQISEGENGVVAIFFENIMKGNKSTLYIFSDMKYGATRDFIYVDDVAQVNLLVLNKGDNEVFNIGTGKEVLISDIYSTICEIVGKKSPAQKKSMQKGDIKRSGLAIKKAKKLLAWSPSIRLKEGLQRTYQSYL